MYRTATNRMKKMNRKTVNFQAPERRHYAGLDANDHKICLVETKYTLQLLLRLACSVAPVMHLERARAERPIPV